jgi:beta-fructofuranosidase
VSDNALELSSGLIAYWPFDEPDGTVAVDRVTGISDPIEYVFNHAAFTDSHDPERRAGLKGGALSFDGYSTWVARRADRAAVPRDSLTVTVWVAPRGYGQEHDGKLTAILNQHDREQCEGYLLGVHRHGSWSLQIGTGGRWEELWVHDAPLPIGAWSFLTAVYDGKLGVMKLYLNGVEAAAKTIEPQTSIKPARTDLLIGKNNRCTVVADVFELEMYSGLMDEVKLYDRALEAEEIASAYISDVRQHGGKPPAIAYKDMKLNRSILQGDKHRPGYHLSPPAHWMNEPHAPIYYNGQYHLFYQHNPQGPFFHQLHWGHWVSDDLVHWRDLPIALAPERDAVDPDGVWSGSASYDEHGVPVLFFTAGNFAKHPNQSVGLARSTYLADGDNDLVNWVKHPVPIIEQPQGLGLTVDFRDPYVWQEGDTWHLIIVTGFEASGGAALAYSSKDLASWTYRGIFFQADRTRYPELGPIWELPVLLPLGANGAGEAKHLFLVSPVGPGADVEVFYWIGRLDLATCRFVPDHDEPRLIDVGDFKFTGPSGMVDPRTGRSIVFTIAQGNRTARLEYQSGWAHNGGLPMSVYLREDGRLGIEPIEELRSLREERLISLVDIPLEDANRLLSDVHGDQLEIIVELERVDAKQAGLQVRRTPDGAEETRLYYDWENCLLAVDRNKTTLSPDERCRGVQGGRLELDGERLRMHVYVDRSLIEAYVNGLTSLTTRAYPSREDALGIRLWSDGELRVIAMEVWRLRSIHSQSTL